MQVAKSFGHDCDHVSGIGINVSVVLGHDGGGGERTNGSHSGGHQLDWDIPNGEDLLCLGVVGYAKSINQFDAQNVVIQMFTDQKGTYGFSILVGGRKGVGPIEFEIIVAGPDDICSMIGTLGMREVLMEGLQGLTGSSRPSVV